jgi:glutamate synthase domain-containing protein 3
MKNLKMPFEPNEAVEINAITEEGAIISYQKLNQLIHDRVNEGHKKIILNNVCGQRFIGAALEGDIKIYINGVPGNDLGIFMDGPEIFVNGNTEDHSGNTMNQGKIVVNGSTGDVTGLSARGGEIYIKDNVGFRVGTHIKEYRGKMIKLVVGGICKEYYGEYMAGGLLITLGLEINNGKAKESSEPIYGNCLGSGIHGGTIYIRTEDIPEHMLGIGAKIFDFTEEDRKLIQPLISNFCKYFGIPEKIIWSKPFKKIKAASKRPFAAAYTKDII